MDQSSEYEDEEMKDYEYEDKVDEEDEDEEDNHSEEEDEEDDDDDDNAEDEEDNQENGPAAEREIKELTQDIASDGPADDEVVITIRI